MLSINNRHVNSIIDEMNAYYDVPLIFDAPSSDCVILRNRVMRLFGLETTRLTRKVITLIKNTI